MALSFFSRPAKRDDWFRVPAVIGVALIGFLAIATLIIGVPATVLFATTGGGFDMIVSVVLLVLFPLPAWRAWKAFSSGRMLKACLWSLTPPVLLWLIYLWISG
jgi:hypothetical protein